MTDLIIVQLISTLTTIVVVVWQHRMASRERAAIRVLVNGRLHEVLLELAHAHSRIATENPLDTRAAHEASRSRSNAHFLKT